MKAKNASSARQVSDAKSERSTTVQTLEDKVEIPEADFKYTLLRIAQKYEVLAESNYKMLTDIRQFENLGFKVKYYQNKDGNLTYEAKLPEKIGF
jgi:hypothetical protein